MPTQTGNDTTQTLTKQLIQQNIHAWEAQSKRVTAFFAKYSDEVYLNEVAPGRNRAIYLLGHLISTSDGLLPLFGLGERLYPELEEIFSRNPDRTFPEIPSIITLRQYWETLNDTLTARFSEMTAESWFERHTSVSPEDFLLEPQRNKVNVLIGRTIHIGYHMGQLTFLQP